MRKVCIAFECDITDTIDSRNAGVDIRIPISNDGPGAHNDLVLAIREAADILGLNPIEFLLAVRLSLGGELGMLADVLNSTVVGY
jgi:hypothetical protein